MNMATLAEQYADSLLQLQEAKDRLISTPQCGKPYHGFKEAKKRRHSYALASLIHSGSVRDASDFLGDDLTEWYAVVNPLLIARGLESLDARPLREKGPWNKKLECGHIVRDKCDHYRDT